MTSPIDAQDSNEATNRTGHRPDDWATVLARPVTHDRLRPVTNLRRAHTLMQTLADSDCPYVIVDEWMNLVWVNRAADQCFARDRQAETAALGKAGLGDVASSRWRQVLHDLEQHDHAALLIGSDPAVVSEIREESFDEANGRQFLIAMSRMNTCDPAMLQLIAESVGLTRSETQVLAMLSEGITARQLAELRNISVFTVRSHIKSIKVKFGCRSITALIVKLARLPRHRY